MQAAPLLLVVVVFGLMWVLVIRPQQQRVRAHAALIAGLKVGDEVVTTGGILGSIVNVDEEIVLIDVGGGVRLKVARQAIGGLVGDQEVAEP